MRRFWLTDNSEEVDEERETIDETVDRRLKWFADITETHPILKFYKDIVETANDLVQKARDKIQSWKDQASELSLAVTNFVENTTGNSQDLSRIVAQQAPVLMNEFPRIDPDGVAVAGLDVTDTGIRPKRDEWDPLAKNRQIDTDFSLADSPPEESVFAEMNPASPAYVPSTPTPTPNPKPTPTPTPNPKPTPTPTPNPKPTPNPPGGVLKTHNGWGVRSIPGVVLTGTYISEYDDAHPFIRLDGSGTGIFEMYGAPAPENVYKIKWWVEAKSDGTLIKTDYPAAIQYTLGVEYVDKPYQGLKFDRLSLAVQKAANGKIYIMDRSKSKN
jgi:hypothetical protein